ncbi:MAG: HD domain-containing protein [Candidatus Calescibacterium sp.]|nr:HD domain-containing protein [Candidatus Calescibacterium sp.]MCX7972533.1 HD domain-containing protein [bacterium]MDW8195574.1 HD domain-containing protein [Candidatus Calescibacterium sp.]
MYLFIFVLGFLMNIIFRKFQYFSISIYNRKIYREDYYIIPTDNIFFLFAFFQYNDPLSIFMLYLGFVSNPLLRKYLFGNRQISVFRVFFNPLSFFIPLFILCVILKFTVSSYYQFHFYLIGFLFYLISNKFLSLVLVNIFQPGRYVNIINVLKNIFRLGFTEGFLFSQFILSYLTYIFLLEWKLINFVFLVIMQISFLRLLYYANNLLDSYQNLIDTLLKLLQEYDMDTYKHSERVSFISRIIATKMGLSKEEVDSIYTAAKLHDIGKIDTPSYIINKPGKLTQTEFQIIMLHPIVAAQIVESIVSEEQTKFIKYHHFYPTVFNKPVTYREIPLGARIIMTADIYDALRSKRKYKPTLSHKEVVNEIFKMVEKELLDSEVVNILLSSVQEFNQLYEDKND